MPSEDLAHLTCALCAIPSVSGDEGAIADRVAALAAERIPLVERFRNAVIASHPPRKGLPTVMLLGHLDTVKPAADQPVEIRGDRVFGCGASDMKGGLAVMLALLGEWRRFDRANGLFVFYDREEGPYADNGLEDLLAAGRLPHPDLALILEPTDNTVQLGCLGSLHAQVTFRGRRAHSARPWQGENALHKAAGLLGKLAALEAGGPREVRFGELVYREVVSATTASTENSRNVVPDAFLVNLNARFAPGKALSEARAELLSLVGDQAEVNFVDEAPAGHPCLDNRLLSAWITRNRLASEPKQAWTDVARLSARGIDAVNFGPGETAQAHQANESVPIAMLVDGHRALRDLLTS